MGYIQIKLKQSLLLTVLAVVALFFAPSLAEHAFAATFDVSPRTVLSGGTIQLTATTEEATTPGGWEGLETVVGFRLNGACRNSTLLRDPTMEFPGFGWKNDNSTCTTLGEPGEYIASFDYRRLDASGQATLFHIDVPFTVLPISLNFFAPSEGETEVVFGVTDVITTEPFGEPITDLEVQCPSGKLSIATDEGLERLNDGLGITWPTTTSFEGDCELNETGFYQVELQSRHQSITKTFRFAGGDRDTDGRNDSIDNCPDIANGDQSDIDGDEIGDACDGDSDNDGVSDDTDNCPVDFNPSQVDSDGDGRGDACDPFPFDQDNDGVSDDADNCPAIFNSAQQDDDGDGTGTACDPDLDGDGAANTTDNCPTISNASQENTDGDSQGDACDGDIDGDGLGNDEEEIVGTDPSTATAFSSGINPYANGQPTGMSNPATADETVGVVISAPDTVTSVAVTVTNPDGNTAFNETLIPHSPVVFSFTPDSPGEWIVTADLFDGTELIETLSLPITVEELLPTPESKDACKQNGWKTLYRTNGTPFKNQGDCVSYTNIGK